MKAVRDVMSVRPVWVRETASFKEIAARLRKFQVSAFPVLDADGRVSGVVSEADLLVREAMLSEPSGIGSRFARLFHRAGRARADAITADELMTSPAVTVSPDDTVEHAARLMVAHRVKRLPVVEAGGRLVGIVGRSDVLAVFDRPDPEIRQEIMNQVIPDLSEPSWYSVVVKDGVVTLEGTPETASIGRSVVGRIRRVQGVVGVRDRLVYPVPSVPNTPGPYF